MDRATWVEVSRDALRANLEHAFRHAGVPVCAVVKANAYGHGTAQAARTFADAGAAMLGVTRPDEAKAIRDAGITVPVLIFAPTGGDASSLDCDITIASAEDAARMPTGARAHLKIDTGMGRLGVTAGDALEAARAIIARGTLAGIWTHFADAAGSSGPSQLDRFTTVVSALRHGGVDAPVHAANSAGLLALGGARFDMVRVGTLLYGQDPPGARAPWDHAETFTWFARVASVRTLPPGATVGYGSEWKASKPTRVATIPVGYADGFTVQPRARSASPKEVLRSAVARPTRVVHFGERTARVLGRVGMQMITVSLDGMDDVGVGSVARIPARRLMVSPLIERVYV